MIRSNLLVPEDSPALKQPPELPEYAEPAPDPNLLEDVLKAPFRGIGNAGLAVGELAYDFADYVTGDSLNDWDPNYARSETAAGGVVQGISNFLVGFIPVFGWLGKVKTLATGAKIVRGAAAGAITDFAFFDAQEGNLSSLLQSYPQLANPVTEMLSTSEDDGEAAGRLKNTVEGLGLGALTDGLLAGLRGLRKARVAKAEGRPAKEVNEALVSEYEGPELIEETLKPKPKASLLKDQPINPDLDSRLKDLATGSQARLWKTMDEVQDPYEAGALVDAVTKQRLEKGNVESFEAFHNKASSTLQEILGMEASEVVQNLKVRVGNLEEATVRAGVLYDLLMEQAPRASEAVKKAVDGSKLDQATALREIEKLSAFANLHIAAGKIQARAFGARRFLDKELLKSKEAVREFLNNIGSEKYVSAELTKWASMDPNQLAKTVRTQMTAGEKILRAHNEYWINSILSGPQTHMVNMMSNAFTSIFLPAERALGGLAGGDFGVVRSSLRQYGFMLSSAGEALRMAFRAFRSDTPVLRGPYGGGLSRSDTVAKNAISAERLDIDANSSMGALTNWLGKIVNLPTRFLMGSDEFFQQINYRSAAQMKLYSKALADGQSHKQALNTATQSVQRLITQSGELYTEAAVHRSAIQAANEQGLSGLERINFIDDYVAKNWDPNNSVLAEYADVAEYAKDQAAEATFTRELEPGTIGHSIQQFVRRHPMTQLAVPFVRTPINLLKFAGQRTFPLVKIGRFETPVLSKIHKRAMADLASGDAVKVAEVKGRIMTGSAILATASQFALDNRMTGGGPPSEQERKALEATGWIPYAFKFGDQYVSYQRFDPFSTLFGVIADYSYVLNRQDDITKGPAEMIRSAIITSLTQNITNKSYLAGIARVVELMNQPERFGESTIKRQLGSYVPNLMAQAVVGLGQDESMREVRTLLDALLGRIPGATYSLEPRRNLLGGIVERKLHSTPWLHNLDDWFNPAVISEDKKDKVWQELADLQHGFTQPSPVLDNKINMLDFKNQKGQSAYDRRLELMGTIKSGGKTLHEALQHLVTSKSYRRLASKDQLNEAGVNLKSIRVQRINKILTRYRKAALRQTYKEFPELQQEVSKTLKLKRAIRSQDGSEQLLALTQNG